MLDLCCYSGGFALNAAAGGASAVTGAHACLIDLRLSPEWCFWQGALRGMSRACKGYGTDAAMHLPLGDMSQSQNQARVCSRLPLTRCLQRDLSEHFMRRIRGMAHLRWPRLACAPSP